MPALQQLEQPCVFVTGELTGGADHSTPTRVSTAEEAGPVHLGPHQEGEEHATKREQEGSEVETVHYGSPQPVVTA